MPKIRNKNSKSINPRIFIYCEGSETERNYLSGYISDKYKGHPLVQFVEIPKIKQNTPKSIVERIISDKKDDGHLPNDIHWAVYDRESKSKIKDEDHLEALQLAKANNIHVVLTNVCIEQWFIYHFTYSKAAYTSCNNLLKDSDLKNYLKGVGLESYDKAEPELYDYLKSGVATARDNAKRINREVIADSNENIGEEQPYKLNPYTNFYELLDEIDLFLLTDSFKRDFEKLKEYLTFFSDKDVEYVDLSDACQRNVWLKFSDIYLKYLTPQSQFSATWKNKAEELLEGELFILDDFNNFYYSNVA